MPLIALPLIEIAAARALALLGATAVAGASVDAARKRQKQAELAKATPIARVEAQSKAKEKCKDCPPDSGATFDRPTKGWSETSISYQARIGGLPVGPGFIVEWKFDGIAFDGFDSSQCMLKEAKARYDQFFDMYRQVRGWWIKGADDVILEAYRQAAVAIPRPPVHLRWHFMQPISYRYFSKIILAAHPDIEVVLQP